MSQSQSNPWKITTIALISSIVAALVSSVVVARVLDARSEAEPKIAAVEPPLVEPAVDPPVVEPTPEPSPSVAVPVQAPAPVQATAPPPPRRNLENCERYRYKTHTDAGRVVTNGLLGGALGAGLGAAGGAIGGSAGKGAGIGALAGAAVGTGYTLHDEHKQKEAARNAYNSCLIRNQS